MLCATFGELVLKATALGAAAARPRDQGNTAVVLDAWGLLEAFCAAGAGQGQAAALSPALSAGNVPFPVGWAAVAAGAANPSCHLGMSGGCGQGAQHRVAAPV